MARLTTLTSLEDELLLSIIVGRLSHDIRTVSFCLTLEMKLYTFVTE